MISALEHYRESAEVLEGWWQVKRQFTKCMRDLKYHKTAFEENLEELLLPLIADDKTVQRLLDCPAGKEWQDPALEEALKARMPKTYSSYVDTMEMIKETLERLEENLGMNKVHFQSRVTGEYVSRSCILRRSHVNTLVIVLYVGYMTRIDGRC
jgi:hypothetical protein